MTRTPFFAAFSMLLIAGSASAQSATTSTQPTRPAISVMANNLFAENAGSPLRLAEAAPAAAPIAVEHGPSRGVLLPALYAAQVTLQVMDVHSSFKAFDQGAVEGNPMMRPFVGSKAGMLTVKVGVAAGTMIAAEHLWKNGNRVQAVALMVACNALSGYVVSHNMRLTNQLAGR
jgi:hypothetical protein